MANQEQIGIFLPSLAGGGAENVMANLANEFAAQGHAVALVLARESGPFLDVVSEDVRIIGLEARPVPGYNLLGALPGLVRYLRSNRPTVLLSALNRANVLAVLAKAIARVDTTVAVSERNHLSTYLEHASTKERLVLPWLLRRTYPRADHVLTLSEGVADDLAETVGVPRQDVTVINNPSMRPEIDERKDEPVEEDWFEDDVPVVIGVGSFTPQKDFATLLRAFAHVRQERPARLVVLGEGPLRTDLEGLSAELDVESSVHLPGFVDNPYAYLSRADVFALSSKWEGFPNVVVEALACGCPVVSTDCPSGPDEILEDGEHGILVPVGDPEALADGILTALQNPPDRDQLRSRAKDFTLEAIAREYLDVLLNDR